VVTYRLNGKTAEVTGCFTLPRVVIGPGDLARAAAAPLTVLQVRLDGFSYRVVVRTEGGAATLSLIRSG
jgi:hypothetical protein